jgi:hypothetical protein
MLSNILEYYTNVCPLLIKLNSKILYANTKPYHLLERMIVLLFTIQGGIQKKPDAR